MLARHVSAGQPSAGAKWVCNRSRDLSEQGIVTTIASTIPSSRLMVARISEDLFLSAIVTIAMWTTLSKSSTILLGLVCVLDFDKDDVRLPDHGCKV